MTRTKEILKEAEKAASANTQIIGDWGEHYLGFIHGAEWADAHPDIDVRTMAAWRGGYKEAIEKACEWLESNVCNAYNFRGDDISIGFIEQFRKAMKGGEQ